MIIGFRLVYTQSKLLLLSLDIEAQLSKDILDCEQHE